MWTVNFQMFKLDLEKAEESEIEPIFSELAGRFFATEPLGKPRFNVLFESLHLAVS